MIEERRLTSCGVWKGYPNSQPLHLEDSYAALQIKHNIVQTTQEEKTGGQSNTSSSISLGWTELYQVVWRDFGTVQYCQIGHRVTSSVLSTVFMAQLFLLSRNLIQFRDILYKARWNKTSLFTNLSMEESILSGFTIDVHEVSSMEGKF